ncbi:MAG: type II secretion system minor pseudopilin GspK [Pseudomonadota bacterium]|uniref:type II secretion system minor pseudopilin GspK n=1 Tax=Alcanivorax sp. TaxID=1872427 RepID=UPI0025B97F74|nr:type II secretion system minor pseudopilin GspK [Alcanivorax sp.]MED5238334.1 type II secretion system minor pseudopilin GspK [Pseudomonadota bacterium]MEE3320180.1 type II secretion system minor pseudopilin GspK [Pseudomonadota bacterium]
MALIIVLMLFAILSVLMTEIQFRQNRFLKRADNLLQWDKRHQYAMAAEVVAQQGLIDDLQDDIKNNAQLDDCVEEQWAVQLPPTPYEDAFLSASVQDLQGRYNLNWLISPEAEGFVRQPDRIRELEQLLTEILPDQSNPGRLAYEMADWLDSNNIVDDAQGAEDPEYRDRRTPNMPAAHESELRALLGFQATDMPEDPMSWGLLTALPPGTTLNVNTAPQQVLNAVVGSLAGQEGVQAIMDTRKEEPISDIGTLLAMPAFSELEEEDQDLLRSRLGVGSEYFQVMVDVEVDGQLSRLVTRLFRGGGEGESTAVISRQVSPLLTPLEPACNPFYKVE